MVGAIFIGTFLPLVLLMLLLRHSRPVFACFCWGMVAFLAIHLVSPFLYSLASIPDELKFQAVFIGPPLEELLKSIPVLVAPFVAQRSFVPFFYILGMASGIGFAVEENLNYLVAYHEDAGNSMGLMVLRSLSTCLMHGIASGLIGFSFTLGRRGGGPWLLVFPVVGWILASLYHGLFNWLVLSDLLAVAVCLALLVFLLFLHGMKVLEPKAAETRGTVWE